MDNVVQKINIRDIIPSNFQPTPEEKQKIEELAEVIKAFGLIDPIIVRPKNGKYEIVLGIDKYQATKIAGLNSIPAIVKEVDDDLFSKYLKIDNQSSPQYNLEKNNNALEKTEPNNNLTIPLEQVNTKEEIPINNWSLKNKNENSDIINLSELNKKEYERNDFKMNIEQINNNMPNNIAQPQMMNQQTQGPTFGGKFFPSLEDEPTNMNMMGPSAPQSPIPELPNIDNNSNLIDLTDLTLDKEPSVPEIPAFMTPNNNNLAPDITLSMNNQKVQQPDLGMNGTTMTTQPEFSSLPNQTTENIINLDNLQSNIPVAQPISQPEPASLETLTADFGSPSHAPMPQQFDMGPAGPASMNQIPEINTPMNNVQVPQPEFGMGGPSIGQQPEFPNMATQTAIEPLPVDTLNANFGGPIPTPTTIETSLPALKDTTPVTNTIKNLVSSLEAFGYKINVIEEELPTTVKLTIEVEK